MQLILYGSHSTFLCVHILSLYNAVAIGAEKLSDISTTVLVVGNISKINAKFAVSDIRVEDQSV